MGSVTIVGLGPADANLITREAWAILQSAENLILRTGIHPTVAALQEAGLQFTTYDAYYDEAKDFQSLYEKIAADVVKKAADGENIVYAVPGSPFVAERTVVLIREKAAQQKGIDLKILPCVSFLDLLYAKLDFDPISGSTVIDANDIDKLPFDFPTALIITQIYDKNTASEAKLALMELLPDDYVVTFTQNLGLPDAVVRQIPLFELDRQSGINHLTTLFVPPPAAKAKKFTLNPLVDVMKTLRSPGGCPWDIAQTPESLRRNIIEECYEVIEAIENGDKKNLAEELGDLLMQIVFQARMAEEAGYFSMQDVVDGITEKLIRRHPHVFGDVTVKDAAEVIVNWDEIKKREKTSRKSAIDGIPQGLPALIYAEKLQHKAAKVGFDWDEIAPVWAKCAEEIEELKEAVAARDEIFLKISGENAAKKSSQEKVDEEFGDLLFAFVNLARFLDVDSELSLRKASQKFTRRFLFVEKMVEDSEKNWAEFTLKELDNFWEMAKKQEIL